ncbi:MAG: signal peptidase I [Acidimicrobiales bacterium]
MAPDITDPTMVHPGDPSADRASPNAAGDAADFEAGHAGDGSGDPPEGFGAPPRPPTRWLREAFVVVVIALAVAVLLRLFVVQTFYIPSGSMEPTLQIGDRILVSKLSYDFHSVHRGDIVVFDRPPTENCGGPEVNDLVKRVIGLPGETISLHDGYVYIDGKRLDETWLPASEQGKTYPVGPQGVPYNLTGPYKIPADHYFMMGDNRTDSCDSRYWGPIDRNLIVGKVDVRVWPLTAFRFF